MQSFDNVRSAVLKAGNDLRVEVNQRALIDKVGFSVFSHESLVTYN